MSEESNQEMNAEMQCQVYQAWLQQLGLQIHSLRDKLRESEASAASIRKLVNEQAEDEGLWFIAKHASEDYLQQALRKIHSAIESSEAGKPILKEIEEKTDKILRLHEDALDGDRTIDDLKRKLEVAKKALEYINDRAGPTGGGRDISGIAKHAIAEINKEVRYEI